jgi:hypothetical protein
MKRKNRKSPKRRKAQRAKPTRVKRVKRGLRKHHPARRRRVVAGRKHRLITDPRVARALGLMRREGLSASQAARREGMKLKTFRRAAGRVLHRSGPGKPWKAHSDDQLRLLVTIPTPQGPTAIVARNLRERKLAGAYNLALRMWRAGEDEAEAALKSFEGKKISGHTLITDTNLLIQLEEAGLLDFENLYASFGAGS